MYVHKHNLLMPILLHIFMNFLILFDPYFHNIIFITFGQTMYIQIIMISYIIIGILCLISVKVLGREFNDTISINDNKLKIE